MEFRDLKAQYAALKDEIDGAVSRVLASGEFIGGPEVAALEAELARYVGVRHCITCANGTDALQLALMAWGVGPGDAVFVPDFTFFSSGEAVSAVGATPVFVDVDELTFNLDPGRLEEAVSFVEDGGRYVPKAVVAVDLFGLPADYPAIRKVCERHGLLLLEDGAQGFGGSIGGRMACSFGDVSTTSFFPAKPLGCYGDGGAVFTDDDEWAGLIRSYAVHGKGSMKYDNVRVGMNSRLDAVQAAILRVKLRAFAAHEVDDVNERAAWYAEMLADCGLVLPEVPEGFRSSWAQYTVRLPEGTDRYSLQESFKERGIPTMVYYPKPMHEQKAFEGGCLVPPNGCPVAERLCRTVLSLPMGPNLTREDTMIIAGARDRARLSSLVDNVRSGAASLKGKGVLGILSGTFLTRAAAFLGSIVLVRVMSKSDYGTLSSLENIYTYTYLLAGMGLNNAVFRWLVIKEQDGERKGVFEYVLSRGTVFNIALVCVVSLGWFVLPLDFSSSAAAWMLPAMLLAIPFQFAYETGVFSFRALFMNRAFAVMAIAVVSLVWVSKVVGASLFGIGGVVLSWPFAYAVAAAVVLAVFALRVFRGVRAVSVPKIERRSIIAYSLQYMVTNDMWMLFMQNDLFMIGAISGSVEAVADYKVAYVFPMVLGLVCSAVGTFVAPYFIKHESDGRWVWRNYKRVLVANTGAVGGAALLIGIVAEHLVGLVYGDRYANVVPLLLLLLVASFLNNGIRYASANLLAAMGRIRTNMVVAATGVVLQILLNLALIPRFGVNGAAITGIIVYGLMAIAVTAYFVKIYKV